MTKHTPGPWEWDGNPAAYDAENEAPWLMTHPWKNGKPILFGRIKCVLEADARLIAVAPEMFEALKAFPGFTNDAAIGDLWIEMVQDIIAKVTGEAA